MNDYYDKDYFDWQKNISALGGQLNLFKFKDYIKPEYNIIDFGSGGGFLLSKIKCKNKIGVEINNIAREEAGRNGIDTVECASRISDDWADLIISNHALEHTKSPLDELKLLKTKLKKGGRIVFVVPNEKKNRYNPNNIHKHLYTWSEMNLGNLFKEAGYEIIKVKELKHKWPPKYAMLYKCFGNKLFHFFAKIYALLNHRISQIKIVAKRE